MKRVTLREPINTLSESGFTIRFAESFCGQLEVGLLEVRYPATYIQHPKLLIFDNF